MARKGEKLSEETKARISASAIARFRASLALHVAEPDHKVCSKCGELKTVGEFYNRKHKLKSGVLAVYPTQPCRTCKSAQRAAYLQRLADEGVDLKARRRRYESHRDIEEVRAYRREWMWKRYREEGRPIKGRRIEPRETRSFLPIEPIAQVLDEAITREGLVEINHRIPLHQKRLYNVRHRRTQTVTLDVVDKILTGLGCPEKMPVLYPDLRVGYHYVDVAA